MSVDCSVDSLKEAAKCFNCISPSVRMAVKTYLLAVIAGGSLDPQVLMVEAKEFQRIPPGLLNQASGYAFGQWAEHAAGPSGAFFWTPASAIGNWIDSGGPHSGNLATFLATADIPTVSNLDLDGAGITGIGNVDILPILSVLDVPNNAGLSTLDLSGCLSLTVINAHNCGLTSLILTGCINVTGLSFYNNFLVTVDVSDCTSMDTIQANNNLLTALDCTGLALMTNLNVSNNALGTVNLTGCLSLINFLANNNPALVVVGP